MKTIIAGCRNYNNYDFIEKGIASCSIPITEVVCGMANGVDLLGYKWAENNGIPIVKFPADWDKYGKAAGPKRNKQMAEYAEALIAFWDYKSAGTGNMIR